MSIGSAVASVIIRNTVGYKHFYLVLDSPVADNYQNDVLYVVLYTLTFVLLYSYMVPISLFVTMEVVKFLQVSVGGWVKGRCREEGELAGLGWG